MRVLRYGMLALIFGVAGCETTQIVDNSPLPLEAPDSLFSVSLNGAIALSWTDNAYRSDPNRFAGYRVYSTSYDLNHGYCGTTWSVEGTTVAAEFLVGAVQNGVPHCYGVTALIRVYRSTMCAFSLVKFPARSNHASPFRPVTLTIEMGGL